MTMVIDTKRVDKTPITSSLGQMRRFGGLANILASNKRHRSMVLSIGSSNDWSDADYNDNNHNVIDSSTNKRARVDKENVDNVNNDAEAIVDVGINNSTSTMNTTTNTPHSKKLQSATIIIQACIRMSIQRRRTDHDFTTRIDKGNGPRLLRFLPSETPRLEALSHLMKFDHSSNNVGRCDGAGCGMWHLEFLDSGKRRQHMINTRSAKFTCGYVYAVTFTDKEMHSAESIMSRSLRVCGRDDKFKFDLDGTVSLICVLAH